MAYPFDCPTCLKKDIERWKASAGLMGVKLVEAQTEIKALKEQVERMKRTTRPRYSKGLRT